MAHTLVIVESPTKARTIRGFLPKDFEVVASMGHVRDLPNNASEIPASQKGEKWAKIGVNTTADFEPLYVVPKDKKKVVKELKASLKGATQLLLATDEDREGESISWHLMQILAPKIPVKRMVFHEITKEAIAKALNKTRDVDLELVHAQETRRILDRLVGYTLSPLLWKKVSWGLSAGRVQSVAVRLLVQRERSRRAFRSGSYWDLKAKLEQDNINFDARLVILEGKKVATGNDFDEATGKLKEGRNVRLLDESEAKNLSIKLEKTQWKVSSVEEKPSIRRPVPPFTTSTLQQESNRKLRLSARETMRCAQALYEKGFITYMRTDSVHLSDQAIKAARECVCSRYGDEYLTDKPRQYSNKTRNTQEAHEAIRPAGETFKTPKGTGLQGRDLSLYELIWKRTVASQMPDARLTMLSVELNAEEATFRSNGKRIDFPGFFRAYVEGSDDPEAALEGQEVLLPNLSVDDSPTSNEVEAFEHQTQPPARYSEASLVKTLEKEGIGRPSTYASIIGTIVDRGYSLLQNNSLTPSFTAFAVTALLEEHFPELVDTSFTAKMESTLDDISTGKVDWLPYLKKFYKGDEGLESQVHLREGDIDGGEFRSISLEGLSCLVRLGKYGTYLESKYSGEDGKPITASIPEETTPADLDDEKAELILKQKAQGPESLGIDPETGEDIYILLGKYGPYVQRGEITEETPKPKRSSLPKGVKSEDLTLNDALGLLQLPRTLGEHSEGGRIQAGLGRFGPYVVWSKGKGERDYRSLKGEDDVLTVDIDRALELLAMPKRGRGGRTALRDLGIPKNSKENIQVFDGPYGLYVKQGKINASLPEGKKADQITLEEAIELLSAKVASKKTTKAKTTKAKTTKAKTTKAKTTKAKTTKAKTTKAKTTPTKKVASKTAVKKPTTTKTGRLRASAVRIIKPGEI
ncbi:type I DNA topoisomerase [Prochlorococcus sp. MIT 1223]|uniref:type I DNA topoisomerase n=1 Tax=Prochlorococcus sp. MIT 1223 TaxID=3096217 RepID=UPI002A759138|nr:type I DNA topoisomerase [Prochlorococcus sp. MIT 1223]